MYEGVSEEQFILLTREAGLSSTAIGEGLTMIRKADFVKHSYMLYSFFSLATGIERLLKLILIYDFRATNGNAFPQNEYLKDFGHKLVDLIKVAKEIANQRELQTLYSDIENDTIVEEIIRFLNDFALTSRYYNLDSLTGKKSNVKAPLQYWEERINHQIVKHHFTSRKISHIPSEDIDPINNHCFIHLNDLTSRQVQSWKEFYERGKTVAVCQKYSMFYCYKLVRFLAKLLYHIDIYSFPVLGDFFDIFRNDDDKYVLSRKTWNFYKK